MSIHIVTHVYAESLPQYAVFLRAQLSSIVLDSIETDVKISVCHRPCDKAVVDVLDEFDKYLGIDLHRIHLDKCLLFRRAIGRNIVAKATKADIVWNCDVDHIFGPNCLNSLWDTWNKFIEVPVLVWPSSVHIQADYGVADEFWQSNIDKKGLLSIDPQTFIVKKRGYNKAIGGVQIVNGDLAREHGYLDEFPSWRKPASPDKPFPCFRDDVKFRRHCQALGKCQAIELPNLYRLRHSAVTYKGTQEV